jgi:hypothetical protein
MFFNHGRRTRTFYADRQEILMLNRLFIIAVAGAWLLPASAQAAVPDLEVRINPLSGSMRIVAVGGSDSLALDGYTIGSNPANPPLEDVIVPGSWNSLTDQLVPGFLEVVPAGQELVQISELNLTGSMAFNPGAMVSLGDAYDTTSGSEDLTFQYSQAGTVGTTFGSVVYDGGLHIRVNKSTGLIEIVNAETVGADFDGYVIQSVSGDLNTTTWNSLEDQAVLGWEETNPTSFAISELNLTNSSVLAAAATFDLGAAYQGGVGGIEDLSFEYSLTGAATLSGVVEYIGTAGPGDFDLDGDVDGHDFLLWQRGGSPSPFSPSDLALWQTNYGAPSVVALSAVPEPSSLLILSVGFLMAAPGFHRRHSITGK